MNTPDWTEKFRDIVSDALDELSRERKRTTNLYLETVPYMKGSVIGPEFQKIRARQRSILVFADEDPMANFGHRCRYRFYDEKTHQFLYEVAAQFPPHLNVVPNTFMVFHEPVRPRRSKRVTSLGIKPAPSPPSTPVLAPSPPPTPAPTPAAARRERYAILFSGSSDRRHLNDLEFCYRMLTEHYGFTRANVYVLNYDNTRTLKDGTTAMNWPEGEPPIGAYKVPVPPPSPTTSAPPLCFRADRVGFQSACKEIKKNLQPQDMVFIHTNGHGGAFDMNLDGEPEDPWLVSHNEDPYYVDQFCDDLATYLPQHESLLIMMQQCYSGQFIGPLIAANGQGSNQIKAQRLSIACASLHPSYSNQECTFDMFTFGWITACLGKDAYGNLPGYAVDTGGLAGSSVPNGVIEAKEAFAYAATVNVAHPLDKPDSENVPAQAGDIQLT